MNVKKALAKFLVLTLLLVGAQPAYANYRLLDSIEQFGENRYVNKYGLRRFADRRFLKPTPARLKAGPVIFHPHIETSMTYDDNILLADDSSGEIEDIVFNIMPGAVVEIPIDTHQIVVGYEADFEVFVENDTQNDQNQNAFALVDLSFPNWYVNVLDRFRETSGRSGSTFTTRIPRYDHTINPKVGYRWNRFTFETSFAHTVRNFRKQIHDSLDFQVSDWTQVVYLDLFARLKALIEYKFAQIDYDDDFLRHGTIHQARVGLEGQLGPNVEVDIRVGPHFRNYDENKRNDFNSWVGYALFDYQMRHNLGFELEMSRDVVESTLAGSNYYKQHSIRFGFDYEVIPKWVLFGDANYYHHEYSDRSQSRSRAGIRRDNHVRLRTGLKYNFSEWLSLLLAYEYRRRDSNSLGSDYTNNKLTVSSSISY